MDDQIRGVPSFKLIYIKCLVGLRFDQSRVCGLGNFESIVLKTCRLLVSTESMGSHCVRSTVN